MHHSSRHQQQELRRQYYAQQQQLQIQQQQQQQQQQHQQIAATASGLRRRRVPSSGPPAPQTFTTTHVDVRGNPGNINIDPQAIQRIIQQHLGPAAASGPITYSAPSQRVPPPQVRVFRSSQSFVRQSTSTSCQVKKNNRVLKGQEAADVAKKVLRSVAKTHFRGSSYRPPASSCLTRKTPTSLTKVQSSKVSSSTSRTLKQSSSDQLSEDSEILDMGIPMKSKHRMLMPSNRGQLMSRPSSRGYNELVPAQGMMPHPYGSPGGSSSQQLLSYPSTTTYSYQETDSSSDSSDSDYGHSRSRFPKTTMQQKFKLGLALLMIPSLIVIMNSHSKFNKSSSSNTDFDFAALKGGAGFPGAGGMGMGGGMPGGIGGGVPGAGMPGGYGSPGYPGMGGYGAPGAGGGVAHGMEHMMKNIPGLEDEITGGSHGKSSNPNDYIRRLG